MSKTPTKDGLRPLRAFVSYSHKDDKHRLSLETALALLKREGLIDVWTDRKLLGGDHWEEGIEQELERADLILFLVSPDFIASDFIWGQEMKRALEREEAGEARVVPIIVRPTDWKTSPFAKLQALPRDGVPVTRESWGTEDEAWLDVSERLRDLIKQFAAQKPVRSKDPTRYLQALEARNAYVEIRGMGAQVAERLPLDQVYTRLRVTGSAGLGPEEGSDEREGRRRETIFPFLQKERDLELPEVLRRVGSTVLIGDPGSGKSTVLMFTALVLARAWLRQDPALVAEYLGIEAGSMGELPFPVHVRLSELARFLKEHPHDGCPESAPEHLYRFLDFTLQGRHPELPADFLSARVREGGCFLLLDGLDEVPGELRTRVAAIVDELVALDSSAEAQRNRILVTCRSRAYRDFTQLQGLPAYSLASFVEEEVAAFVRGWSRALFLVRQSESDRSGGHGDAASVETEAARYEEELLAAIRSHANVGPLTESPLMLTMLAVVHWSQKKLPERRNELYEEVVTHLLETRKAHSAFPVPQRREALQALALAMFTDADGVQRAFGLQEAAEAVAEVLQVPVPEARRFVDAETLESGLLVSRNPGEVEFWHLSFQEYLAALDLAQGGEYWEVLSQGDRLYDDRWSEVVLLLAGCIRRLNGPRPTKRFLERILATGNDTASCARAVGLVGRALVDVLPYGGDPSIGTSYLDDLNASMVIFEPPAEGEEVLPERVRFEVGEALGRVGDPRLADPKANWVKIPGGTFWMGAQSENEDAPGFDSQAYREAPVHRVTVSPFRLGRYPVTVQEYGRFLEAGGYSDPGHWDPVGWAWREEEAVGEPGSWKDQLQHRNRPVVEVSWYEADAYCRWVGGRLPTETEWEFAARGAAGRLYPWGPEAPDPRRANFEWNLGTPSPIGIYPLGFSPEAVSDLAGNVWEYCQDWWCAFYSAHSSYENVDPSGPPDGVTRVLRGGAFNVDPWAMRGSYRDVAGPAGRVPFVGFRVVLALRVEL